MLEESCQYRAKYRRKKINVSGTSGVSIFALLLIERPSLTEHGGLFEEFVAGLKSHLLQGRGVGADGMPVQRLVDALEAHVVGDQRQVSGVNLDTWILTEKRSETSALRCGEGGNDQNLRQRQAAFP